MTERTGRRIGRISGVIATCIALGMFCWTFFRPLMISFGAAGPDSVIPVPRPQMWWRKLHRENKEIAARGGVGLLFIGDSITMAMSEAKSIMQRLWGDYHPLNLGIGGDTTQILLWRIENGEFDGLEPQVAVLLIGTNNLGVNTEAEIVAGVAADVEALKKRLPRTKVLLLGITPRMPEAAHPLRSSIRAVNGQLKNLDDGETVFFLDVGDKLTNADGSISKEIMPDYLHFSYAGYDRLFRAIKPQVDLLLSSKR